MICICIASYREIRVFWVGDFGHVVFPSRSVTPGPSTALWCTCVSNSSSLCRRTLFLLGAFLKETWHVILTFNWTCWSYAPHTHDSFHKMLTRKNSSKWKTKIPQYRFKSDQISVWICTASDQKIWFFCFAGIRGHFLLEIFLNTHLRVQTHALHCPCACAHIHTCTHTYKHMHMHAHTHTHTHTHIYI